MSDPANPALVIFTARFPYGKGESFLANELVILKKYFNITLIPSKIPPDTKEFRSTEYQVEAGLSGYIANKNALQLYLGGLWSLIIQLFVHDNAMHGKYRVSIYEFKRLIRYRGLTYYAGKWLSGFLGKWKPQFPICYTYWLSYVSLALAGLKPGYSFPLVSRVHGFDLYEERRDSMPKRLKNSALQRLNAIIPISLHGQAYLLKNYQVDAGKMHLFKLGVFDPGFMNNPSPDNTLRLVSCSYMVEVKRIHLIIEALALFRKIHPGIPVQWHHMGAGPLYPTIREKVSKLADNGLHCVLHGDQSNQEVYEIYRNYPFDAFINVSSSEGLPVSVMEAQSVGIPVIATAVGGTPEIVNPDNGKLLSPNPDPAEIAEAFYTLISEREQWIRKRECARKNWEVNFNATTNFEQFARELMHFTNNE